MFLKRYYFSGKALILLLFLDIMPSYAQQPLTLDSALKVASESSPAIKTASMNLEQSRLSLQAQRAALKSKFSLNLNPITYGITRNFDDYNSQWYTSNNFNSGGSFSVDQPVLLTGGTVSLTNNFSWQNNYTEKILNDGTMSEINDRRFINRLSLNLNQPIFKYNQHKMDLNRSELNYENLEISYALEQLRLEQSITQEFYDVYRAQSELTISRDELANSQQSYTVIKNKVEAELSPRDELYQAELNLANARSKVETSQVSLENAKDALRRTLGIDLDTDISVRVDIDVNAVSVDPALAVDNGLASRLELRQRQITTKRLEYDLITQEASNKLNGAVNLSLGLTGDNEALNRVFNNPIQSPQIAVSLTVPIFDWGARRDRIKAKQVEMKVNELEGQEEIIDIEMKIRQACRSLASQKTQVEIAEQSVKNAQLTYDLNMVRYRNGDITGMEYNQFQTQLSTQKNSYISAVINYKIALLALKILSLYDFEKSTPIVPLRDYGGK